MFKKSYLVCFALLLVTKSFGQNTTGMLNIAQTWTAAQTFSSGIIPTTVNATSPTAAYEIGGVNFIIQPDSDTSSIAIGPSAAANQSSTGLNNTIIGDLAFEYATSASYNVAVGMNAMNGVSGTPLTGTNNTAVGAYAEAVVQGVAANNTAIGDAALRNLTTGGQNTAVGSQALLNNITGNYNSALGYAAGMNVTGTMNTALGYQTDEYVSSGNYNTGVGTEALQGTTGTPTTGSNNTAVGYQALQGVKGAGASNTALGYQAGQAGTSLTTGSNDTFLGYQASPSTATDTNEIVIGGNAATGLGSNSINIGGIIESTGTGTPSTSVTTIEGSLTTVGTITPPSVLATGIIDGTAPITLTTTTTANLGSTYNSGYTFNQEATAGTGVTYTLPATAVGKQYCVQNSGTTGVVNTGALTVYPPASSFVILSGVVNTVGGGGTHGVASGGAAGDGACFVAIDATHWEVFVTSGTWSEN